MRVSLPTSYAHDLGATMMCSADRLLETLRATALSVRRTNRSAR
jgi:hypothetical protein